MNTRTSLFRSNRSPASVRPAHCVPWTTRRLACAAAILLLGGAGAHAPGAHAQSPGAPASVPPTRTAPAAAAPDLAAINARLDALEAAVRALQNAGAVRGNAQPSASQAPSPAPAPGPAPAGGTGRGPQVVNGVMRATVGPGQQCPHLVDCWLAAYQKGATDVVLTVMPVPGNPAYYQNDISGPKPVVGYLPFNVTLTAAPMPDGSRQMVLLPVKGVAGDVMPTGKGWFIPQRNFTIEGFHITGGADGRVSNYAAIRSEGTNQTIIIRNCELDHWGNGVLGTSTGGTIVFDHVYLHDNGDGSGSTHNVYLATFDRVQVSHMLSTRADTGHLFKSRAKAITIENSRFFDLDDGTASYGIDIPDGAVATISDTVIQRGRLAQNGPAIAFAEERLPDDRPKSLALSNVTIVSQTPAATPFLGTVAVWNPKGAEVTGQNVRLSGVTRQMQNEKELNARLPGATPLPAAPALDLTSPVFGKAP